MSDTGTRVVLVKPGDVLVFGNVGHLTPEDMDRLRPLKDTLRLAHIVAFPGDIDLAAIPQASSDGG